MSSYFTTIGYMACTFAVATLLQNIRNSLVDNDRSPVLQSILQIICLVLWVVSLPITIVAYFLWLPKHNRQEALHKKELAAKALEGFEMLDRKLAPLEKELATYRELASSERASGYKRGRKQGYEEGYILGHRRGSEFTMSVLLCPEDQRPPIRFAAHKAAVNHVSEKRSDPLEDE